jgi:hypothetical protein
MIADLGLRAVTFQRFRDFEGMPEPQRSRVFSHAERKFDVMQELGCDLLLVRKTDLGGIRSIPRDRIFLVQVALGESRAGVPGSRSSTTWAWKFPFSSV